LTNHTGKRPLSEQWPAGGPAKSVSAFGGLGGESFTVAPTEVGGPGGPFDGGAELAPIRLLMSRGSPARTKAGHSFLGGQVKTAAHARDAGQGAEDGPRSLQGKFSPGFRVTRASLGRGRTGRPLGMPGILQHGPGRRAPRRVEHTTGPIAHHEGARKAPFEWAALRALNLPRRFGVHQCRLKGDDAPNIKVAVEPGRLALNSRARRPAPWAADGNYEEIADRAH